MQNKIADLNKDQIQQLNQVESEMRVKCQKNLILVAYEEKQEATTSCDAQ